MVILHQKSHSQLACIRNSLIKHVNLKARTILTFPAVSTLPSSQCSIASTPFLICSCARPQGFFLLHFYFQHSLPGSLRELSHCSRPPAKGWSDPNRRLRPRKIGLHHGSSPRRGLFIIHALSRTYFGGIPRPSASYSSPAHLTSA